jgi:hypothetical protein
MTFLAGLKTLIRVFRDARRDYKETVYYSQWRNFKSAPRDGTVIEIRAEYLDPRAGPFCALYRWREPAYLQHGIYGWWECVASPTFIFSEADKAALLEALQHPIAKTTWRPITDETRRMYGAKP